MAPLFACSGCGLQIERSTRLYLQLKGRVLCSTCLDRREEESVRSAGIPEGHTTAERQDADREGR